MAGKSEDKKARKRDDAVGRSHWERNAAGKEGAAAVKFSGGTEDKWGEVIRALW